MILYICITTIIHFYESLHMLYSYTKGIFFMAEENIIHSINIKDYHYLVDLGYSSSDINAYCLAWNKGILDYLSSNKEHVSKNMLYLQTAFNKDLLLKLPVFYPSSFALEPMVFIERFEKLKVAFPYDYAEIVEKQFWGYEGYDTVYVPHKEVANSVLYEPFLEVLANGDESVIDAVMSLTNPTSRHYKFLIMLQKNIGLDVSADDVQEEYLLDLECGKWKVLRNAENLIELGLAKDLLLELLWHCPHILTYSASELESVLSNYFGDNYIEVLHQKYDDEILGDELCGLS